MTIKTFSPTAAYLADIIEASSRSQKEIAEQAGFPKPNVISMMKSGEMKVPIDRIPDLAYACNTMPFKFVILAMQEYHPAVLDVLQVAVADELDLAEADLVANYRLAGDISPIPFTMQTSRLFLEMFKCLAVVAADD